MKNTTEKIICGNSIDVLKRLAPDSVDLAITDRSYLVNYRDEAGRSVVNDSNTNERGSRLILDFPKKCNL